MSIAKQVADRIYSGGAYSGEYREANGDWIGHAGAMVLAHALGLWVPVRVVIETSWAV